jgi:hypothetical protein
MPYTFCILAPGLIPLKHCIPCIRGRVFYTNSLPFNLYISLLTVAMREDGEEICPSINAGV